MRRSRAEEPLPSNERWMLSWSDFVTLLLAVFAAMYAGASMDLAKANAVARSVGQALGAPAQPVVSEGYTDENELVKALLDLGLGDRVRVQRDGHAIAIDIDAEVLFAEGDARLSVPAGQLIAAIAQVLRDRPYAIRVEGHTDATPISNLRFASNWELSSARAAVVVRKLTAAGITEARLSAVGLAANQPLGSNLTVEGRARNRRVQLLLLPS